VVPHYQPGNLLLQGLTASTDVPENAELQQRAEAIRPGVFLGGPRRDFEKVGRHCFSLLLNEGLLPEHAVVDIGCGALRNGYWLIHYLDPERYFGLEPNQKMLRVGRKKILEPGLEDEKRPTFSDNDQFDLSTFGDERFDFLIARSVWTHASKPQIAQMLESFRAHAGPGARFLASYLPARPLGAAPGATHKRAFWMRDYKGDEWVGASHQRKKAGLVAHSKRWIKAACAERDLEVQTVKGETINHQRWLRITAR
jgi:hypothetical protein